MKWKTTALALLVAACGPSGDDTSMEGMSAEEHTQMDAADASMEEMSPEERAQMEATDEADPSAAGDRQVVFLSAEQERMLGVTYTTVGPEQLTLTIRTVGRIEAAEPLIVDVTPKIAGFVEELFVDYTGQSVRAGQPLLSLYSPIMVAAQEELLTALRLMGQIDSTAGEAYRNAQAMVVATRRRLEYWDITAEQIDAIAESGQVTKTLTLVAPFGGIVLSKDVFEGQRVSEGARLYRIADLSRVWVEGDVFEQDIHLVREGARVRIEVAAYPGEHVNGVVSFIYPTVDVRTRTNRVRATVNNPGLRLKPGMYSTIFFDVKLDPTALTIPLEAVIITGQRNLVFVREDDGMLYPREVVLGTQAGRRVQVLAGLEAGETVVASANFLVDAESRLASTGGVMSGHAGHGSALTPERPEGNDHD